MTKVLGRQPLEDYAAFRIHGLTPESAGELRASFGRLSADDALALRIHGATPEFVREMRDAGFASLSADDAVAFRIHGVTPEFVRRHAGSRVSTTCPRTTRSPSASTASRPSSCAR